MDTSQVTARPCAASLNTDAGVARFMFRTRVRIYRASLADHRRTTGRPATRQERKSLRIAAEQAVPFIDLRRPE